MAKIVKLFAYAKAPFKTFALLHPVKVVKYGTVFLVGKSLFSWGKKVGRDEVIETREETSEGDTAAKEVPPPQGSATAPVPESEPRGTMVSEESPATPPA